MSLRLNKGIMQLNWPFLCTVVQSLFKSWDRMAKNWPLPYPLRICRPSICNNSFLLYDVCFFQMLDGLSLKTQFTLRSKVVGDIPRLLNYLDKSYFCSLPYTFRKYCCVLHQGKLLFCSLVSRSEDKIAF